jgi:hypothetical protein
MSIFKDINNKSNINTNKSYNKIFSEQGKNLMKKKENFTNKPYNTLINNNIVDSTNFNSKKQHYFKETFENNNPNNINKKLLHFPKLNDVNKKISIYEKKIANSDSLISDANNLLNDTSIVDVKNTYSDDVQNYKSLTDELNKNTTNYVSKGNKNKNVYVTSLSSNTDATFKGLYNDNLDNPSMNIIQTSNYDDCKNIALLTGKKYFGLLDTDKNNHLAKCAVSDTVDNTSQRGYFKDSCAPSNNDGFMYGGSWANAIYKTKDGLVNADDYIGCYKDKQDGTDIYSRAMYPASWLVTRYSDVMKYFGYYTDTTIEKTDETNQAMLDKLVYQPVFFAGNSGDGPWGVDFIDKSAQWLWYTQNAQADAPINENKEELIFGSYTGPSDESNYIIGTIHCCCDNFCKIKVNGSNTDINDTEMQVNGWSTHKFQVWINPSPSTNIIELFVINAGGPAGVMLSILNDNNEVICRTTTNFLNTSDVGGSCTWLSSSKVSKVQVPLTNEFSVQSCAEYANLIGFPYIGLQYIQNNEGGTAQCFVTNSLDNGTRFGSLGGSVEYDNKTYGIGPANAVYELNNTADPSLIGSIGYIDENNQLLTYPNSMISYGDTYTTLKDYQSNGDIYYKGSLDECKQKCNENEKCNGFNYLPESECGFFSSTDTVYGYRNTNENINIYKGSVLYMRDPKINNNESCSKSINPITADDWISYMKNNSEDAVSEMTSETTCGLYKTNQQLKEELEITNKNLNKNSEILVSNTTNIINTNEKLSSQIKKDKNVIKDSSKLYGGMEETTTYMVDNNNLNNILENTNIVIKQSQYYYIIWIILIVLIIIGVIIILRRI